MLSYAEADAIHLRAAKEVHEATERSVKAALLLMCITAREQYPDTKQIALEDSDQGAWQVATRLLNAEGDEIDSDETGWDDEGTASFLYDSHSEVWLPFTEGWSPDSAPFKSKWTRTYLLDVDKVLRELGDASFWQPPAKEPDIIEILHVRDPDSGCEHRVFLNGKDHEAFIEDVDPGAGYEREGWDEYTELVREQSYSPEFRNAVVAERDSAAEHSQYITD